jgi:aerobic-type carbon monoxide dehydrogenase small subunit (CoxS/CutS family)
MSDRLDITVTVNGQQYEETVPVRMLLSDFLRQQLGLTGTHVGCEHGVCGNCTILVNGRTVRSCLMLAVQVDGLELKTIEGYESHQGELNAIQQAFYEKHGLQCGFCTPGMLATVTELLEESTEQDEQAIRERISGVICRCTGYQSIVESTQRAAELLGQGNGQS